MNARGAIPLSGERLTILRIDIREGELLNGGGECPPVAGPGGI
jgi:hypothetical protein